MMIEVPSNSSLHFVKGGMLIMRPDTIKFDNTQLLVEMGLTKCNEVKIIDLIAK